MKAAGSDMKATIVAVLCFSHAASSFLLARPRALPLPRTPPFHAVAEEVAESSAAAVSSAAAAREKEPWTAIPPLPALELELALNNGEVEKVWLRSESDAEAEGVRVSGLHPRCPRTTPKSLQREMVKRWKKAGGAGPPPVYQGLSAPAGQALEGLVGSFAVGDTGLVLDVAESLVAPGAGLGLFLRKSDAAAADVVLPAGQAVCGYPAQISDRPVIEGGKTILFAMNSLDDDLFFEGQLVPLGLVLDDLGPSAELAAHTVRRDEASGCPLTVRASDKPHAPSVAFLPAPTTPEAVAAAAEARAADPDAFRYLVPFRGADFFEGGGGRPSGVAGLGDQANDLALESGPDGTLRICGKHRGVGGAREYEKASLERNLLVSRPALELVETANAKRVLVPRQPLLIAQRSVTIANSEPMEVGHAYGYMHWEEQLKARGWQ